MFIVINDVQRLIGLDTLQEFMAAGKGDGGGVAVMKGQWAMKQVMKKKKNSDWYTGTIECFMQNSNKF